MPKDGRRGRSLPVEEADDRVITSSPALRRRDDLRRHLERRGIETGVHYPVPLHRLPAWIQRRGDGARFPNAELLARSIVSIPVFPELNDAEVEDVAGAVRSFFTAQAPAAERGETDLRAPGVPGAPPSTNSTSAPGGTLHSNSQHERSLRGGAS